MSGYIKNNLHVYANNNYFLTNSHNSSSLEIVERKFRGHPDSLTDMVAQRFAQLYIQTAWKLFPELQNKYFPNFSADKITLCGASTVWKGNTYKVLKPIYALLLGKITNQIGDVEIDIDLIFKQSIEGILIKSLGVNGFIDHVIRKSYAVDLAGADHNSGFYHPKSVSELLKILSQETVANDTVYVVAYAPLTITEKLSIKLDNITASNEFKARFPQIGSDIKSMIKRRSVSYDITMCLPFLPEKTGGISEYKSVLKVATDYLESKIESFLLAENKKHINSTIHLSINTKDTAEKKYFAIWGTSLSKGDIGAVGRGNRQQGFISGNRPSTNEAFPGKNPNHFAGVIYQLIAENIANDIYVTIGVPNTVYISANNGDVLNKPTSIDILLDKKITNFNNIQEIVHKSLSSIAQYRAEYLKEDVYERFMQSDKF